MSEKAQRFSNRKANKVAGQSTHVPKAKWEEERYEKLINKNKKINDSYK